MSLTDITDRAARDALLFQTTDVRLRKKLLAEDMALKDMVKMGLNHEQTQMKSNQMARASKPVREYGEQCKKK